jgi:hypothetical protein
LWLAVRFFRSADAFKVLGVVGGIPGTQAQVVLSGAYETPSSSKMDFHFEGVPADAAPVREFLESQMRAAREQNVDVAFTLTFAPPIAVPGDDYERIVSRLTRYADGVVEVEAFPVAEKP